MGISLGFWCIVRGIYASETRICEIKGFQIKIFPVSSIMSLVTLKKLYENCWIGKKLGPLQVVVAKCCLIRLNLEKALEFGS